MITRFLDFLQGYVRCESSTPSGFFIRVSIIGLYDFQYYFGNNPGGRIQLKCLKTMPPLWSSVGPFCLRILGMILLVLHAN